MVKRNGVFVGGYLPKEVKEFLQNRARIEHSTVSVILKNIVQKEMKGNIADQLNKHRAPVNSG